jgi:hydrogenase/urease accessory protein HupE
MKHGRLVLMVAVVLLVLGLLSGCATRNPLTGSAGPQGVAGLFTGLVHGLICPIAFVVSLFNHDVAMYEVHNSGGLYNFGFLLGAGAWGILRIPRRRG